MASIPRLKRQIHRRIPLINSEVEILTSSDLGSGGRASDRCRPADARCSEPKATLEKATEALYTGLDVSVVKGTNIISVSFKSADPKLPMPILQELVKRYFDKHLEVHRSVGAFDFVTKETEELQNQLNQTEAS